MLYSDANLVKTMGFKLLSGNAPEQLQNNMPILHWSTKAMSEC